MKSRRELWILFPFLFVLLAILHFPFLRLPYFWDEAGYYVPAALDFYRHALLIPRLTPPNGHTPLLMAYLAAAWHLFGFQPVVTRLAVILIAAAVVLATYALARRLAGREAGAWAALLLALSPSFFAQSSLVYPSLPSALFTTLAVLFALDRRWVWVAFTLSLAVLSKEIAVVAVPVLWAFLFFRTRERGAKIWGLAAAPVIVLGLWTVYYHGETGFWTGNGQYLQYNLYSALRPLHVLGSLFARIAKVFILGFNWVVVAAAAAAIWEERRKRRGSAAAGKSSLSPEETRFADFQFLALGLVAVYIAFLGAIGGAILSRYLLPVFPVFYVLCVALIARLPKRAARLACLVAALCFIGSWFVNPPYPFPYDDNLAYSHFVRLHERAAEFLESLPGRPVILSAWPATDELCRPFLGYVTRPLRVARIEDFTPASLARPPRFDLLYLYSRRWYPASNWLAAIPFVRTAARVVGHEPPERPAALVARFHLTLLKEFRENGQWVRIYAAPAARAAPE